MRLPVPEPVKALAQPSRAFTGAAPPLGATLGRMLILWTPLALTQTALTVRQALDTYGQLRRSGPPAWMDGALGADPEVLGELFRTLPPPPAFGRIWPWLLVAVPLGLLGTWLHHAVWDHTGLWLLGGLKEKRGFRTSLVAEAEALRLAALGTGVSLAGFLPGLGPLLTLPLLLLGGYLWLFRGFALAARHGCETWRGVAATVVHAVLLGGCLTVLGVLMLILLRTAA